jgi:hypothetical protein
MSDKQLGTYHMIDNANPSLYEVARSNNFEFIVNGVSSILKAGAIVAPGATPQASDLVPATGDDTVRLSVARAFVPNFTQDEIVIQRGNTKMYAAGVPTFEAGSLVVNDFIGIDTKSVILAWQRLCYDATTERVGRMADYKKTCFLIEYTPDYQIVRKWRLDGCWVKGVSESEFTMEDGGKRMVTANIRFDRAMPIYDEE